MSSVGCDQCGKELEGTSEGYRLLPPVAVAVEHCKFAVYDFCSIPCLLTFIATLPKEEA